MKGILIQQKVSKAIDQFFSSNTAADKKVEADEFVYSSFILNWSDFVIRKIGKHDTTKALWEKLEQTYIETSLPNKLFLLEKYSQYKLDISKDVNDNLDTFTKLIQDIKQIRHKNIDEYTPIVLILLQN